MKITGSLLFFAMALGSTITVTAQVDPQHSFARLSLSSGPSMMEVGVARVSGALRFADGATVDLVISPDNHGQAEFSDIRFQSRRASVLSDGTLAVAGDLSLLRAERRVMADANEAYSGPVYGEPVLYTETREVTLLLPNKIDTAAQNGVISASIQVSREQFPYLVAVLAPGKWPSTIVNDQRCAAPINVAEDYAGATCTGTVLASTNIAVAPANGGDGYYGFELASVPDGKSAAIDLSLVLERADSAAAVVSQVTRPGKK